ncbi:MAG: hypothetical protein KC662_03585 [Candidatus Magasanikbacteria bacterium]|nr:hypothetical protein [Candidatus Magasanikbacteria bacterium]
MLTPIVGRCPPYEHREVRLACNAGECYQITETRLIAIFNDNLYLACKAEYAAQNAQAESCTETEGGEICSPPLHQDLQITDTCILRTAYVRGGMGLGLEFMTWAQGRYGDTARTDTREMLSSNAE